MILTAIEQYFPRSGIVAAEISAEQISNVTQCIADNELRTLWQSAYNSLTALLKTYPYEVGSENNYLLSDFFF